MKLFKRKKEEKAQEIKPQEVVQKVVKEAEEKYKEIKEQTDSSEEYTDQDAYKFIAEKILQIFMESPKKEQYMQDIAEKIVKKSNLPTEVVLEMVKRAVETNELPNSIAEKMAKKIPDKEIVSAIENDDNLKLSHKEVLATGIADEETRLEVEKDIRTQKEIAEEKIILEKLNEIYKNCREMPERIVVDTVREISIRNKTKSINELLDKIVARRIAIDYFDYGNPMLNALANIVSIPDMYEYHIADLVEEEFNQLPVDDEHKPHEKYSKRDFEDKLLKHMAKDVANKYFKTSKFIIPQNIERFKSIDKRQKGVFISSIEQETGKQLKKMQLSDIEAQMQGIYGINQDIDNLEEKLYKAPKMKATGIINIASEMTKDDDRSYNTIMALQEIGVLETLVKMPREKREKYIEAFARFMQDREIRNQKKKDAKGQTENITSEIEESSDTKNDNQIPKTPGNHGENDR